MFPSVVFSGTRALVDLSHVRILIRFTDSGGPLSSRRLSSAAVLFSRGVEVLEADSCCKSSHSWRAPGSPRLICRTSNVTNHPGVGNTSLSSSLCLLFGLSPPPPPFFFLSSLFVSLSLPHLPSPFFCSLSNSSSLVLSLTRSAKNKVGNKEKWSDGTVLFLCLCERGKLPQ